MQQHSPSPVGEGHAGGTELETQQRGGGEVGGAAVLPATSRGQHSPGKRPSQRELGCTPRTRGLGYPTDKGRTKESRQSQQGPVEGATEKAGGDTKGSLGGPGSLGGTSQLCFPLWASLCCLPQAFQAAEAGE